MVNIASERGVEMKGKCRYIVLLMLICVVLFPPSFAMDSFQEFKGVFKDNNSLLEADFVEFNNRVYISIDSINEVMEDNVIKDGNVYRIIDSTSKIEQGKSTEVQLDLGDVYVGTYDQEGAYLYGHLFRRDGSSYKGAFKSGVPEGNGISEDPQGNVYIGQFANGLPHGDGKMVYANGNVYKGQFRYGTVTGYGRIKYKNDDTYLGYLFMGLYHGGGTFSEYKAGIKQGLWEYGEYKRYLSSEAIENYIFKD